MAGAQVRQEETSSSDTQEDAADVVIVHENEDEDEWDGDDGYVPRTKEEILEGFRDAVRELKLCLEGKHEMQTAEDFLAELAAEQDE